MASIEGYSLVLSSMGNEEARSQAERSEIDPAALVGTYTPLLFRVAHSVLRSRAEAEDVVQDVFLRVLGHRHSLSAILDMRVWLIRIAWNLALDRRRRLRPEQMDQRFAESLVAHSIPADQALDESQHIQAVLREIDRLPRQERHVLLLSAIEEMGIREIVRQTSLEGTSLLTPGEPLMLGSLDVPGTIHHLDIEILMEAIR